MQLSFTGTELYRFKVPIGRNVFFKNQGKIGEGVVRFLSQTNSILLFRPRITVQNFIKTFVVTLSYDFLQIAFYRTFVINLPHVVTLSYMCRTMFYKLGDKTLAAVKVHVGAS